jgi:hypothetical protein
VEKAKSKSYLTDTGILMEGVYTCNHWVTSLIAIFRSTVPCKKCQLLRPGPLLYWLAITVNAD